MFCNTEDLKPIYEKLFLNILRQNGAMNVNSKRAYSECLKAISAKHGLTIDELRVIATPLLREKFEEMVSVP